MKTLIILFILGAIGYIAFKSLYKTLTGKGGCSCSSSQKKNCPAKKICDKNKTK